MWLLGSYKNLNSYHNMRKAFKHCHIDRGWLHGNVTLPESRSEFHRISTYMNNTCVTADFVRTYNIVRNPFLLKHVMMEANEDEHWALVPISMIMGIAEKEI